MCSDPSFVWLRPTSYLRQVPSHGFFVFRMTWVGMTHLYRGGQSVNLGNLMKFGVPHFQTWTGLSALPMPCHHCCVVDVCLVWGRSITGPSLAHHRSISGSIGYSWSCTSWVDPLWVGPKISRNKVAPEIQIKRIGFVPSSTRPKQHLFIFVQTFWYYIRCIHPYASFLD